MRALYILLAFIVAASATAQTAYIVNKDGEKITVRPDAIEIILIDKRISYKLPGKTWEKYITYKDLDYAVVGPRMFKTFRLDGSKKDQAYFVNAESKDKMLVSTIITTVFKGGSITVCSIAVINTDTNTVIERLAFRDSKKDDELRAKAAPLVRKYFSDCPELMTELENYGTDDIMGFFNVPLTNCH